MVEQVQPEVIREMRRWHRATMDELGDRNPVLFTHYEVAFRWRDNGVTRQLFAPDYFDADFDRGAAHEGIRLSSVIGFAGDTIAVTIHMGSIARLSPA